MGELTWKEVLEAVDAPIGSTKAIGLQVMFDLLLQEGMTKAQKKGGLTEQEAKHLFYGVAEGLSRSLKNL